MVTSWAATINEQSSDVSVRPGTVVSVRHRTAIMGFHHQVLTDSLIQTSGHSGWWRHHQQLERSAPPDLQSSSVPTGDEPVGGLPCWPTAVSQNTTVTAGLSDWPPPASAATTGRIDHRRSGNKAVQA